MTKATHENPNLPSAPPAGSVVPCGKCGCLGNCSCGHEPLDEEHGCTLGPAEICSCCRIKRKIRDFRAMDKTVRDNPTKAKLKIGQIIVEQPSNGVIFSFPAAVWPRGSWKQAQWVERLTPWWDLDTPGWTAQSQRLRDTCVNAINKLLHGAALPENREHPAADGLNVRRRSMLPNDQAQTPPT